MVHIYKACLHDVDALTSLAQTCFKESHRTFMSHTLIEHEMTQYYSHTYFIDALRSCPILLARADDHLVGYIKYGDVGLTTDQITTHDIELHRIFVSTAFQRHGIGSTLLDHVIHDAHTMDKQWLYVGMLHANIAAQDFYTACGFTPYGNDLKTGELIYRYDLR